MKYLIILLCFASIGSILCGLLITNQYSEKLIGFGVVGLFILVFPLFLYYSWKGKSLKDYMITKENLDKMRNHQKKH